MRQIEVEVEVEVNTELLRSKALDLKRYTGLRSQILN
jgi:hypothetical protein